jgi:hypothetical protein
VFPQNRITPDKRTTLHLGPAVLDGNSRNVAMVFDDGIMFDQSLRQNKLLRRETVAGLALET